MRDMTWNVYVGSFNSRDIRVYNVFDHSRFMDDIRKIYKKHKDDFNAFSEEVRRSLMYYFWSKCEWEIVLTGWPPKDDFKDKKIDVYDQIMLNWDAFIKYVWEMSHARRLPKK